MSNIIWLNGYLEINPAIKIFAILGILGILIFWVFLFKLDIKGLFIREGVKHAPNN